MPTDKLAQALEEQKMLGAENDAVEVIAKALRIKPVLAARVACMCRVLDTSNIDWTKYIPTAELQEALEHAARLGAARLMVRRAIMNSKTVLLPFECMVAESEALQVCNGCPQSLLCLAQSLHVPKDCRVTLSAVVYPLRFVTKQTVEVECAHPAGKFVVPLKHFIIKETR